MKRLAVFIAMFLLAATSGWLWTLSQASAKDLKIDPKLFNQPIGQKLKIPEGTKLYSQEEACKNYAEVAIKAFSEEQKLGCGYYPGAGWGGDYQAHYLWCMSGNNSSLIKSRITKLRDKLDTCRACNIYAGTAVLHNKVNDARYCGYTGGRWNSNRDYHFKWCLSGNNQQKINSESRLRKAKLDLCRPLNGDFQIVSIKPDIYKTTGFIKTINIEIKANTQKPWLLGRYGPGDQGSLWLDLKIINKTGSTPKVIERKFSLTGKYNGKYVPTFVAPVFGNGMKQFTIKAATSYPFNIRLEAFKMLYHHPGGIISSEGFAMPGSFKCSFDYPDIEATVYIITTKGVKKVKRIEQQIQYSGIYFNIKSKNIGAFTEVPLRGSGPCP